MRLKKRKKERRPVRGGGGADKNTGECKAAPIKGHFHKANGRGASTTTLDTFKRCDNTKNMKGSKYNRASTHSGGGIIKISRWEHRL